ncbi:TetR/AcrR family transcriptional regulator [Hyphomonas sp.]|uniref:TetR/AcrR family transcriptional regulator n=1 Tax=Hyphomonas sp. TaxID=87 RepID=UPI003F71DFBF
MKNRLADAAYQVAADEGVGALTVRAIVDRAGVSQGALLHHFPNKEAIILGTIERTLELARRDSERYLKQSGHDHRALLLAYIDELRGFFFSDRFWVAISITVEFSRRSGLAPHLTERVQALRAPVYEAWAQRFMEAGWAESDARKAVRSGAALVSGLAMRRFWAPPDEIADQVLDDWIDATLKIRRV